MMIHHIINIITMLPGTVFATDFHIPGYFKWTDKSVAHQYLYCPNCCDQRSEDNCIPTKFGKNQVALCCVRYSIPFWEFPLYKNFTRVQNLMYTDSDRAVIMRSEVRATYDIINDSHGNLTAMPDNICQFPNLTTIKLTWQKLEYFGDLSCLKFLDTLDLRNNRILYLNVSSFSYLSYLRILFLSNNGITYIEPGTFKYRPGSLSLIDLKGNRLTSIDVTNVALGYFFRKIDLSYNMISTVTNKLNWTGFEDDQMVGGGIIDVSWNDLTTIPTLAEVGIRDISFILRGLFNYELKVHHNPFNCDCDLYIYIKLAAHSSINFDAVDFECYNPPLLRGYRAETFLQNPDSYNYLVCDISMKHKCPPWCRCHKQPHQQRVVVNCTSTNRTTMPNILPDENDLHIDLSYNVITHFIYYEYLNRTKLIDLSYNRIATVDPGVFRTWKVDSIIILHHNDISVLHRSIQLIDPCKIQIGNVTLGTCSCDMQWIPVWMENYKTRKCLSGNIQNVILCEKNNNIINMSILQKSDLCIIEKPSIQYVWLGISAVVCLVFIILFYNFRHEIKICKLQHKRRYFPLRKKKQNIKFDVYLSFNADNEVIRRWNGQILCKDLESRGFKVCLPPRDFVSGGIHADQIHRNIELSQSFIVVLSQDYEESQFQTIEWNKIWSKIKSDRASRICVINYDLMKSKEVTNRKLKAFVRLGLYIDFSNFDNHLFREIERNLTDSRKQNMS